MTTPIYKLVELNPTTQERIIINSDLRHIEALLSGVDAFQLNTPPASPAEGYKAIVGTTPTGVWTGFANHLALYFGGAYTMIPPSTKLGRHASATTGDSYRFDGTNWVVAAGGGGVQLTAQNIFTKAQGVTPVVLTDAATIAVDASLSNTFLATLAGDRTLANPTNLVSGFVYNLFVTQDSIGSRLLTFGNAYKFGTVGAPTLTPTANATDWLSFMCVGSSLLFAGVAKGFV
jgi:Protein of unknown function (DUF2793)